MSHEIAVFKKPSSIIFTVAPANKAPVYTVKDAQRGNTFLHKGAVCMLTEVSAYQALAEANMNQAVQSCIRNLLSDSVFIVNLQTGRTFSVKPDDEIEWIKVTMSVEGQ